VGAARDAAWCRDLTRSAGLKAGAAFKSGHRLSTATVGDCLSSD